jgi:hypothetical protein
MNAHKQPKSKGPVACCYGVMILDSLLSFDWVCLATTFGTTPHISPRHISPYYSDELGPPVAITAVCSCLSQLNVRQRVQILIPLPGSLNMSPNFKRVHLESLWWDPNYSQSKIHHLLVWPASLASCVSLKRAANRKVGQLHYYYLIHIARATYGYGKTYIYSREFPGAVPVF